MSEIKKNIETCRGEDVLAEVSAAPQDPHFGSLVNEAFDPMQQQALHQAGYDGYSEVIAQHKPYTFASAIIQMKSNLLLLLRALWQFPFGSGTLRSLSDDASLRSLSDMWQHYIDRLHGSETYGIPSRLSDLTDLPSAPLLLADRKIAAVGAPDGIGLMQLVLSHTTGITKIGDTYPFDLCYRDQLWQLVNALPNLNELELHCKRLTGYGYSAGVAWLPDTITKVNGSSEVLEIPELERFEGSAYTGFPSYARNFKTWRFPNMTYSRASFGHAQGNDGYVVDWVEEIDIPKTATLGGYASNGSICNFTNLAKLRVGNWNPPSDYNAFLVNCPKLIHVEVGSSGELQSHNLNLKDWDPTDKGETFLSNFRTYIALRLATFASNGPTLTLSQAVYDAIKDESHLFVFDGGTMTIYAYLTNIKHWTVTK